MRVRPLSLLLVGLGCGGPQPVGAPAVATPDVVSEPPAITTSDVPAESPALEQPPYPLRVARVSDEVLARSERDLRARTTEPWTEVRFDPYGGLLRHATIVEPEPSAFPATPTYDDALMRERWSRFLAENAAWLALDAPGMEPIRESSRSVGFRQVWAGHVVGSASVSWYEVGYSNRVWRAARVSVAGHGWPVLPADPTVRGADELAAQLVGRQVTRVVRFRRVRQACDPPGGARINPCGRGPEPPQPPELRVPHELTRADVIIGSPGACRYVAPGASEMELRLVVTASVRLAPAAVDGAPDGFAPSVGFEPAVPLPRRIDAVTGEELDAGVCDP